MKYILRKTTLDDYDKTLEIYQGAREFMKTNGNPDQWGDNWPSREIIKEDIIKGISYSVTCKDELIAIFAFKVGIDVTYLKIWDGKWSSEETYGTVHRLASSFKYKGIFPFIQNELEKMFDINFRIDTHENNKPMINQVLKVGYTYAGKISPIEGGERLAFEKIRKF